MMMAAVTLVVTATIQESLNTVLTSTMRIAAAGMTVDHTMRPSPKRGCLCSTTARSGRDLPPRTRNRMITISGTVTELPCTCGSK
jgi:hypothetical protein